MIGYILNPRYTDYIRNWTAEYTFPSPLKNIYFQKKPESSKMWYILWTFSAIFLDLGVLKLRFWKQSYKWLRETIFPRLVSSEIEELVTSTSCLLLSKFIYQSKYIYSVMYPFKNVWVQFFVLCTGWAQKLGRKKYQAFNEVKVICNEDSKRFFLEVEQTIK